MHEDLVPLSVSLSMSLLEDVEVANYFASRGKLVIHENGGYAIVRRPQCEASSPPAEFTNLPCSPRGVMRPLAKRIPYAPAAPRAPPPLTAQEPPPPPTDVGDWTFVELSDALV